MIRRKQKELPINKRDIKKDMLRNWYGFKPKSIDFSTAIEADITAQDYFCYPRNWYADCVIRCGSCKKNFIFSAQEQKTWYEEYKLLLEAYPRDCWDCRKKKQDYKNLYQHYCSFLKDNDRELHSDEAQELLGLIKELFPSPSQKITDRMNFLEKIIKR